MMLRRMWVLGVILVASPFARVEAQSEIQGVDDPRVSASFVKGLSNRGYHDLAAEYLEYLRKLPDTPSDVRETIDYEIGRLLIEEAQKTGDLGLRSELLDQARGRLDAFAKAHPDHKFSSEARVLMGRLLINRGSVAILKADETDVKAEKDAKLSEGRNFFDQARTAYDEAVARLEKAYDKFPKFIPDNDPRKDESEKVHDALMQAKLQRAIVDYEQGQTYPVASDPRKDLMGKALQQFETLYQKYRTQMAGLTAQMWEAKCYEEQGDLGKAMGLYNVLLEHSNPILRPLQRHVGYFKIIALGKRKQYALAADEADRWLKSLGNNPAALRQQLALGVQLELAKDIIAQLPDVSNEAEKNNAIKKVVEKLSAVVRYSSPYKSEAIELIKKYKPKAAENAMEVARLNYDDALSMGNQAISTREWDRGVSAFRQAVKKAEAARDVDKMTNARHHLAFCYYMDKRYYEAAVIADHVARRYPGSSLAPKTASIGMASLAEAYKVYNQADSQSDLKNLIDLTTYTADTYPNIEEGDNAKFTLGQIYQATRQNDKAIKSYESVRPKSQKRLDALTKAGETYWFMSQALRKDGKAAEADAASTKALATLQGSLKAREDSGAPVNDPGLLGNAGDIAEIYIASEKPAEAVKLLDPIAKKQAAPSGSAYASLMSQLLRAHVALGQVDLAMTDMSAIEKAGDSGLSLTQLYFNLGQLLEKEIERLDKKGDMPGRERVRKSFLKALDALVGLKTGQTFTSLQWVGEQRLKMEDAKGAEAVYRQVLDTYGKDPAVLARPDAKGRLMAWNLGLSASYRGQRKFDDARLLIDTLLAGNPKSLEPIFEKGMLLEDLAEAKQGQWTAAATHWRALALRLARSKPVQYYDAWYHAALALNKGGKPKEAEQTLGSVMRLSPKVGGPEMKKKYETLLTRIKS